jgi:hypothetical protein
VCFVVYKTTSEQERAILTTLYLASAKNMDSWHARNGDLQRAFPLDVLMVPSSTIVVAADSECLRCGGFCLSETVCLGNIEFITDYFSGLSLSPRRGNTGAAFIGSTHNGAPTPRRAMIEDSIEEFLTMSSAVGEEVLFHQCEEITLIYRRFLELLWVGGGHTVEEGNPSKEIEECTRNEMCARWKIMAVTM